MVIFLLIPLFLVGCSNFVPTQQDHQACYMVRTDLGIHACKEVFILEKYAVGCYNTMQSANARYKIDWIILGGNAIVEKVECWNPMEETE